MFCSKLPSSRAGRRGRVGSASDCRAGGRRFKSQHPTSAETRMWGRQLAAMLALYTSKGVAPEVNLREHISCMPPHSSNKAEPTLAFKPRGDITRRGISGPTNRHVSNKNFKKNKKTSKFNTNRFNWNYMRSHASKCYFELIYFVFYNVIYHFNDFEVLVVCLQNPFYCNAILLGTWNH